MQKVLVLFSKLFHEFFVFVAYTIMWWFGIGGMYGAGHTNVISSPFYNSPEAELRALILYIPILAIIFAVITRYVWPFIFQKNDKT